MKQIVKPANFDMVKISDAYELVQVLLDLWRKYAMRPSGTLGNLNKVPVFVEVDGNLREVTGVVDNGSKIILTYKDNDEQSTI